MIIARPTPDPAAREQFAAEIRLALTQTKPLDSLLELLDVYQTAGLLPRPGANYVERLRNWH